MSLADNLRAEAAQARKDKEAAQRLKAEQVVKSKLALGQDRGRAILEHIVEDMHKAAAKNVDYTYYFFYDGRECGPYEQGISEVLKPFIDGNPGLHMNWCSEHYDNGSDGPPEDVIVLTVCWCEQGPINCRNMPTARYRRFA